MGKAVDPLVRHNIGAEHHVVIARKRTGKRLQGHPGYRCECACGYVSVWVATEAHAVGAAVHHVRAPDRLAAREAADARRNGVSPTVSHLSRKISG